MNRITRLYIKMWFKKKVNDPILIIAAVITILMLVGVYDRVILKNEISDLRIEQNKQNTIIIKLTKDMKKLTGEDEI